MYDKALIPREYVERTIIYLNPNISDEELLDLREKIFLKISIDSKHMYIRDYYLYTRNKSIL